VIVWAPWRSHGGVASGWHPQRRDRWGSREGRDASRSVSLGWRSRSPRARWQVVSPNFAIAVVLRTKCQPGR
jgi:hypothetical protein